MGEKAREVMKIQSGELPAKAYACRRQSMTGHFAAL